MSTPTGGSWNNDQQGQGAPQGGQGGYQGQSLGQGYGQQQGQQPQQQPAYGQQAPQQPDYGQQAQQPAYGQQHGRFGDQAQQAGQQFTSGAGQIASGAGEGVGDLFSDLQFTKSLTEKIAGLTYLLVIVWAVINFINQLIWNFGSQDFGGQSVKHMSTLSGIVHSLADLALLVVIVAIVRVVLELAVNVARIAQRSKD